MKINTDDFNLIREAEYDPDTDMLRMVVVCRLFDVDGRAMVDELEGIHDIIKDRTRNMPIVDGEKP